MSKVKIAMIGVGCISGIYLKNLHEMFKEVELIGVCDKIRERAEKAQEEYNIPKIYDTMYDAFADEEVDIILNLTRPYEHFDVSYNALKAGKNVYSEKPLGATFEEGEKLVALAEEKGLMLGGAPDTFLGAGIQTCKQIIDNGLIGDIVGCSCAMLCHGHETWHPDPDFYYQFGGGPIMDMGPYYVTALVNLLGGINSVSGTVKKTFEKRTITSKEHYGEIIDVNVQTHVLGTMNFDSGAIGTIITSFDVHKGQNSIEIYGTKGTLYVPDPNFFSGEIKLFRPEDGEIKTMPITFKYKENSRALGLADMAKALQTGRFYRANYKQTLHVLEVITGFEKSSNERKTIDLKTKYTPEKAMENPDLIGFLD